VDGPYGNLNLNYRRYPRLVLVAGGIGITPVMGLLRDAYRINVSANAPKRYRKSAMKVGSQLHAQI